MRPRRARAASNICSTNSGVNRLMSDPCEQICELLRSQNSFLVLTHYRPDGDAVGSQLALVLLLKGLGKTVEAWNDDDVPAKFRFLPQTKLITRPPAEAKDFDVV